MATESITKAEDGWITIPIKKSKKSSLSSLKMSPRADPVPTAVLDSKRTKDHERILELETMLLSRKMNMKAGWGEHHKRAVEV